MEAITNYTATLDRIDEELTQRYKDLIIQRLGILINEDCEYINITLSKEDEDIQLFEDTLDDTIDGINKTSFRKRFMWSDSQENSFNRSYDIQRYSIPNSNRRLSYKCRSDKRSRFTNNSRHTSVLRNFCITCNKPINNGDGVFCSPYHKTCV